MKFTIPNHIGASRGAFAVLTSICMGAACLAQGGAGGGAGGGGVGGAAGAGGVTGGGVGGSAAGGGSGGIGGGIAGGGIGVNGAAPGGGSLGSAGPMGGTSISSGAGNAGMGPGGTGAGGIHSGIIGQGPGSTGNPSNDFRGAFPGAKPGPGGGPRGITGGSTLPGVRGPLRGRDYLNGVPNRSGGNGRIGRGKGATPAAGDKNPAKTLLDEMNGTHDGRRSGQAAFRGQARRRMERAEPFTPPRVTEQAVYFGRRGAYEDAIYRPTGGSYRANSRRYDNRLQAAIRRGGAREPAGRRSQSLQ